MRSEPDYWSGIVAHRDECGVGEKEAMPLVSVGEDELSYSFNGAQSRDDGPTLVLVHGAGGQKRDWPVAWRSASQTIRLMGLTSKSDVRQLEHYPTYAIDLPGHGRSTGKGRASVEGYADAVASFLEALDLEKVVLVGHSMGAAIALTLAVRADPRLAGIALIGGSSRMVVSDAILDGLKNDFEPTIDAIIKYSWHRSTGEFFRRENRQRLLEAGPDVVFNDFLACSRFDLSDRLSQVTIPVLVIAAEEDRMVPQKSSLKMADTLAHATFVSLERCGHCMHIERPRRVAEELSSFMENQLGG